MTGGDDYSDRRIIEDLRSDLRALSAQVGRMADRMEDVAVLAERVETNRSEIKTIRKNIDAPEGVLDRLAKIENGSSDVDHVSISWRFLAALVAAGGTVAAALVSAVGAIIGS